MTPSSSALFRAAHRVGQLSAGRRLLIGCGLGAVAWVLAPAGVTTFRHLFRL